MKRGVGHFSRGVTLIELMVTLTILGLLGTLVAPVVQVVVQRRQEQQLRQALHEVRQAIDMYKHAYDEGRIAKTVPGNGYPATLDLLVEGVPDQRNPKRAKLFFMRRVPRDPFNVDSTLPAAKTWVLRSYASDAADPREGDDVYDIASGSQRIGLNDAPYRSW